MTMYSSEPSILDKIESIFAEKKSLYIFGTCGDRQIYPTQMARDRLGNSMNPIRGPPNLGPGCYDLENKTNMIAVMNKIPRSNLGYALGTKTAPRFQQLSNETKPVPRQGSGIPATFDYTYDKKPNSAPFLQSSVRFGCLNMTYEESPGPGTYNPKLPDCKQVQYHGGFGGRPTDLPDITLKSKICRNTEKLNTTKEEKRFQRRLAYLKLYYT